MKTRQQQRSPDRSAVVLSMSMDAFITGPDDGLEDGVGVGGDHHGGVPVFVLTHDAPDEPAPSHVRYVTDGTRTRAEAARRSARPNTSNST
jgi:hypothetical protein